MARYFLLLLFIVMLVSGTLGLELSLAPGLSVKNAFLYLIVVLLVMESAIASNRKIELLPVLVPFGLLIAYALITWLAIVLVLDYQYYNSGEALISLKGKLGDQFLILLVFFYGVTNAKHAVWLLKGLIWVIVISNAVTFVDTLNIPDLGIVGERSDGRAEGPLGNANLYGAWLAFFLPATIALYRVETGFSRRLALFGVFVTFVLLLMTGSRGAYVGTLAGGALATLYLRQVISKRSLLRAALAVTLLCAVALIGLLLANYGDLLGERVTKTRSSRIHIWLNAYREMAEFPLTFLTGFGWDAYYHTMGHRLSTESDVVETLYDLGAIGLALFMATFSNLFAFTRRSIVSAKAETRPYLMAMIFGMASLVIAMIFNNLQSPAEYAWAFTGLVLRIAVEGPVMRAQDNAFRASVMSH